MGDTFNTHIICVMKGRCHMQQIELKVDIAEIPRAIEFLDQVFSGHKIHKKNIIRSKLAAEEIIRTMIRKADEDTKIIISAGNFLGECRVNFHSKGEAFSADDIVSCMLFETDDSWDEEANDVIHQMFRKVFSDDVSIRHQKGVNKATLRVHRSAYTGIILTLAMAFLGILTGLLLQLYVPKTISDAIIGNLFVPVYSLFMNALKMIVGPLVFCSIAASIADFGNLKALGKIAMRVVGLYLLTSVIAIGIGFLTYSIFPIGDTSLAISTAEALASGSGMSISLVDTLVNIVPKNIIEPFIDSDMMQIIFLAVSMGMVSSAISEKAPMLKEFLNTMNLAFSKFTTVIITGIPIIVFCAMAKMMATMDLKNLLHAIFWIPVIYAGDLLMICVYCVLLLLFTGLNPLVFLKKYLPAMISAFTLSSSNAALPSSMKACDEMGVSKKIYSFSLPLGSTINMDGSCITLMITALFFTKIFGIPVTGSVLLSLFISIMVLSVGSPGVPGGVLVCITILVPEIGIPAEAASIVMGMYPLVGMMQTCANVTGDAVVSTIVAKKENELDLEKFYS